MKNLIINSSPWMINFLVNKDDAYKYTKSSTKEIEMMCPYCGYIRNRSPKRLNEKGFACPRCSDGISYPNKFMLSVLSQLGIDFKNEITHATPGFGWITGGYRYDFYFVDDHFIPHFIEVDGHYHDFCKTTQLRDAIKNELASLHNIDMIRIPCAYKNVSTRFNFIKQNILNSCLPNILHFVESDIDWDKCNNYATSSLIIDVCKLWNGGIKNTLDIANIIKMCRLTVENYLKIGVELGLCDYNPQAEHNKVLLLGRTQESEEKKCKPIAVYNSFGITHIFKGAIYLSRSSKELFGQFISRSMITLVCNGKATSCKGITFKLISDEEYDKYYKEFNGEINPNNNIIYSSSNSLLKPVIVYKNGKLINIFISCDEAAKVLSQEYGVLFQRERIKNTCLNRQKQYNGFNFKHITKEQYEQYKVILKENNVVVKEVI